MLKFIFSIILSIAVLFVQGCLVNTDSLYSKAVKLMDEDKLDRAERLLRQVLESDDLHQNANYALAVLLMKQERYQEAVPAFQKTLKINPNDVEAMINLGVILARTDKIKEAEDIYGQALSRSPGNSTALLNLARLYQKQQKLRESRLLYEKILRSQPNLFSANKELAYVLASEGRLSEAIDQFNKAMQLNKNDAEVLYELGSLNYKKGNFKTASKFLLKAVNIEEKAKYYLALGYLYEASNFVSDAITSFQKAYEKDKASYEATFRLGVLYMAQGSEADKEDKKRALYEKSKQILRIALGLNPQSAEAHKYMGILYFQTGELPQAKEFFLKAKALNEYVMETHYYLGMIALKDNRFEEARTEFEREIAEFSGHAKAQAELARLLIQKKETDKAINQLKLALEKLPKNADLWEVLGQCYLGIAEDERRTSGLYVALENYDEAISALRNCLNIDGDRLSALELLLQSYDGARRYAVAIPYIEQYLKLKPENYKYYLVLAMGYSANQDYNKAIEILRQYLSKQPNDAEGWFQLGKTYADKGEFLEGIEIFQKAVQLDGKDPKKKLFLGMLLAEVNKFQEALEILKKALEQSANDADTKKRCEDLMQQILDASGIKKEEAEKKLGKEVVAKVQEVKVVKKPSPGSLPYVKGMLLSGLKQIDKLKVNGKWTPQAKKEMLGFIKLRLVRNYRQLVKHSKFVDKTARRYYFLGIRRLIEKVKTGR